MSKSYKIAGLVMLLLGVMVATQYVTGTTPEDINANKPKTDSEKAAAKTEAAGVKKSVVLPKPLGPKDAPVKVKVYVTSDNTCDTETVNGMKAIANKFGKNVYLEYVDILDKSKAKEAQKAKISCKSGLTINGMSTMLIPGHGVKGLVMFDGPLGKDKNYGLRDVEAGIEHLLAQKTKKAKA